MNTPKRRIIAGALALTLIAAACGSDDDSSSDTDTPAATDAPDAGGETTDAPDEGGETTDAPDEAPADVSGTVLMDGSSTVGPLTEVAAELFMEEFSNVRVTVGTSGTSGGFAKFCIGETDGNSASRPIKDEEIEICGENNIAYEGVQVANDALSLLVNAAFPIECMTVAQANQIWGPDSTTNSWADVEGLDLPDQAITLYGPGTDSGTFDFFTEVINGEEGAIRNDYIDIGEDDFAGVVAVEGDPWAMSYTPFSFVQEAGDSVKALQIDNGDGCQEATLENVQSGVYAPLGRPLFIYASDAALSRPEVVEFFDFYIANQAQIAELAVFVPMNDEQVAKAQADIDGLKS